MADNQEFNTLTDAELLAVDENFDQETYLGLERGETTGDNTVVNLSNFAQLKVAAEETGNRWTARISYEMASWTETGNPQNQGAQGSSTMGGLLKTSISLQEGNMEFQITKGIVDAAASKAASTAADIGRSAKGQ